VERFALIGGLLLLGLVILAWVFWPVFRGPGPARRDVGTLGLAFGSLVAVLVLNGALTLPLAGALDIERGLTLNTFLVAAMSTQVPMLLVVYARFVAPGAVSWQELGLRPMSLDRVLRVGLTTGLVGLIMTVVLQLILQQVGLRANQVEQFDFVRSAGTAGFALVLTSAAVTAPFVEELFFRGMLFGLLRRRHQPWVAYVVSGVLFAALHLVPMVMNPAQMAGLGIGIFALGTLLAWTYQRTGSLYPSMVAHAVNNATGLVLLYTLDIR
jgi:membrane protease YdiL (CAAX protease family)